MAVMFDITSDMKKRLEAEKLSMQEKAQSALTQDQFEVCDKIIALAADTVPAQMDDLAAHNRTVNGSTNDILPAERDDLVRMIGQLGAAFGVQISEKDADGALRDATISIGTKMLILVSDAVLLSPNRLRKVRVEIIGWQIVLSPIKCIKQNP